jgi:Flp pilus assembly pilin Flp
MKATVQQLWTDDSAQTMTEYALIIGTVVVGIVGILIIFKDQLKAIFSGAENDLTNAATP